MRALISTVRRGGRIAWLRIGAEVLLAAAILLALAYVAHEFPKWPTDVDVYRLGADTFLQGHSVYTQLPVSPQGGPLPYTYPPFSVLVFIPLALVPPPIGYPLLTGVTALALIPLVLAYRNSAPELRGILNKPWMVLFAALALLVSHPVKNTVFWGQINVLLMLLVALDVLSPNPRWPRGLLIGIAAAIKLTPAGFALIFLLRKDWRAVITSFISFLVMAAIGFVFLPGDSVIYWTDRMFHATGMDIGLPYANEGLTAGLSKLGMTGTTLSVVGGLGLLAVVAMTVLGTLRAIKDDNLPLAMGVTAAGVLLVSPISWSHHWILMLPTAALVLVMGYQRRNVWLFLSGAASAVILWMAPHYKMPLYAEVWSFPQKVAGSSYQLVALALLVVMAVRQLAGLDGRPREGSPKPLDFEITGEPKLPDRALEGTRG